MPHPDNLRLDHTKDAVGYQSFMNRCVLLSNDFAQYFTAQSTVGNVLEKDPKTSTCINRLFQIPVAIAR